MLHMSTGIPHDGTFNLYVIVLMTFKGATTQASYNAGLVHHINKDLDLSYFYFHNESQ